MYLPGEIDILLGAQIFLSIVKSKQFHLGLNRPCIRQTEFGYILSGKINRGPRNLNRQQLFYQQIT